jgi:L-2,4-diaminobutyrate decarboxylase
MQLKFNETKRQLSEDIVVQGVAKLLDDYIINSKKSGSKVLQQKPPREIAEALGAEKILKHGFASESDLLSFISTYLTHTNHLKNPKYLGHQVAVTQNLSGIPEWINGVINNPSSLYEMGPAGATLEGVMINYMLQKLGWFAGSDLYDLRSFPDGGSGFLTHGGSIANLTALAAARAAIAPNAWEEGNPKDLVVIGPANSHYSIGRAISILGLGKNSFVPVPVFENEKMDTAALETVYQQVRRDGKRVMAVIANACATSTGLFDNLNAIGNFCQKHNLWYHVDGAHGASALLSSTYKEVLDGIQTADSLIWDAHKMMRVPALCTAVLFKKARHQKQAFQQKGSYVFHENEVVGIDSMPYTVECTKSALGTKLFWTFALYGEQGIVDYIDTTFGMARSFYELLQTHEDFYCPFVPESNILCFQYTKMPDYLKNQLALRYAIIDQGKFYLTSCEIQGVRYLRVVFMNPETTLEDCKALLQEIEKTAASL